MGILLSAYHYLVFEKYNTTFLATRKKYVPNETGYCSRDV